MALLACGLIAAALSLYVGSPTAAVAFTLVWTAPAAGFELWRRSFVKELRHTGGRTVAVLFGGTEKFLTRGALGGRLVDARTMRYIRLRLDRAGVVRFRIDTPTQLSELALALGADMTEALAQWNA
jgi:hypothetical protein